MKVLFISSWYPNSVHPLKGLFVKKHAAAIKSAGVDIEVVAITVSPSSKTFEKKIYKHTDENGIVTHQIELNSRFYKWIHLNLYFQYRVISKYIEKSVVEVFKPDIIHSNVLYPAGILGYKIAKHHKLPHIITEHWSRVDKFISGSLFGYLGKKTYNNADCVTVVSDYLKNSLSKHFTNPDKIKVVPNVISTKVFNYHKKNDTGNELNFTCVAHWNSPKRPDLIFESLNEVAKSNSKSFVLNVVGEGALLNDLKHQTWNFKINYCGNLSPDKLATVLHKTDYFLHASEIETFSIVIAEALATGTPVLASNVGATGELINNSCGYLTANTKEEWVKNLNQLLKVNYDHALISRQAERFSPEKIGGQFLEIYNALRR